MTYNKDEVMKAWREEWHIKLVSLAQELTPYPELEEKMFQFWEEKVSTALDSAFKAGRETQIEHCAEPECPECNIAAYKAGVGDCIAIVEECSDFADSGHTLKMRIINQIQALK